MSGGPFTELQLKIPVNCTPKLLVKDSKPITVATVTFAYQVGIKGIVQPHISLRWSTTPDLRHSCMKVCRRHRTLGLRIQATTSLGVHNL